MLTKTMSMLVCFKIQFSKTKQICILSQCQKRSPSMLLPCNQYHIHQCLRDAHVQAKTAENPAGNKCFEKIYYIMSFLLHMQVFTVLLNSIGLVVIFARQSLATTKKTKKHSILLYIIMQYITLFFSLTFLIISMNGRTLRLEGLQRSSTSFTKCFVLPFMALFSTNYIFLLLI